MQVFGTDDESTRSLFAKEDKNSDGKIIFAEFDGPTTPHDGGGLARNRLHQEKIATEQKVEVNHAHVKPDGVTDFTTGETFIL